MSGQQNKSTNTHDQPPDNSKSATSTSGTAQLCEHQCCACQEPTKTKDNSPSGHTPVEWAECLLVVAAYITLGFMFVQTREIPKTTETANVTADAALKQTQYLVVSQRAWMTQTQFVASVFTNARVENSTKTMNGTMFQINWTNAGHTSAVRCSFVTMQTVITDKDAPSPTFTPVPDTTQNYAPIAPNITVSSPGTALETGQIEALKRRECRVFIYSRVDYEIVFPVETPPHTEICVEVLYAGNNTKTGEILYNYRVSGPQNSAT
jgi:hypothetical protein